MGCTVELDVSFAKDFLFLILWNEKCGNVFVWCFGWGDAVD